MIEILSEQIARTMKLLQVTTLDELEPWPVTQLTRSADLRPRSVSGRYRARLPGRLFRPRQRPLSRPVRPALPREIR